MKRLFCLIAALGLFITCTASVSAGGIEYIKYDGDYDYSGTYVTLAAYKESGKPIPLSIEPLDGYTYAYLPSGMEDAETEIKEFAPQKFSDLYEEGRFEFYINEMSARGVLTGYEDGTFRPDQTLTRGEAAVIFSRLFGIEPSDAPSVYSDVPDDSYACGYIAALTDYGVFKADNAFEPDAPVTREQLTAVTCRMLAALGFADENAEYDLPQIRDIDDVSDYALSAYRTLYSNGYNPISDLYDGEMFDTADDETILAPQSGVTRYECADYLYNLIRSFFYGNAPAIGREEAADIEIPVLDGSTSTYDITRNIYAAFYLNYENLPDFPKSHSKTSNAYKRLIDGEAEVIFVPDPSEEIQNYAAEKGVTLKFVPIANEALVFFTSDKNNINTITSGSLREIYVNNSIENWSELGGEDAELVAFCRNDDSGSHAQMEKFILQDGESINEEIRREHTSWLMSSILTEADSFNRENEGKYAIGYSLYYYYENVQYVLGPVELRLIPIDGVEPTEETISSGAYPFATSYYAVVRDEENERVDAFLEFLQSETGGEIIEMSGLGKIQ